MPKLFSDESGVSPIVAALLLILITVIAAASLAVIVSQAEKNYADRQAQQDAISNENLTIVAIAPQYYDNGSMQKIDIIIQNLNIDDAKIGSVSVNDMYATIYHCDGDHNVTNDTRWTDVPASKTVVLEVGFNTTDFQAPPQINNTDMIKVQVSTSYYNFFERTFKPPVAIAKFNVETENLGVSQHSYIILDPTDSYSETGHIKYYNWTVKDASDYLNVVFQKNGSASKVRFDPPSSGPFVVKLTVQDDIGLVDSTDEFNIAENANYNPPININATYDQSKSLITATLYDTKNHTSANALVNFIPTSQNITVWPTGGNTNDTGVITTNVTFLGSTTSGTVQISCGSLTYTIQVRSTQPEADFTSTPPSGNVPLTVQFTDNSSGVVNRWQWDFGDGATSTQQNPVHTFTSVGSYNVKLTALNSGGSNTTTHTITVNPAPPVADFSGSPTSGSSPLPISFTDKSSGNITNWLWEFGDGTTSTSPNPSYTYINSTTGKTYTVKLTVSNAGGSNTMTKTDYITINPLPPTAAFTSDRTSGQPPLTVQFQDTSTGPVTGWQWDFGDGSPNGTTATPTHTYTSLGQYNVTLTVTNDGGSNSIMKPKYISVNPSPPSSSFTSDKNSGQTPLTVQFTDTSIGSPVSWLWNFGDGSNSKAQNPIHTFPTNPGPDSISYIVKLTATNAGGSTTSQKVIMVNPLPPVALFTADMTAGSSPLTVQFTDNSAGSIKSYLWDFSDGSTSTAQNPIHTFPTNPGPGNMVYAVKLTVTNGGGSSDYSINITVNYP